MADSAIVVRGRVKVRPGEQWRVGRELNRRIKRRFDELGIEFPFPQRTVHLVTEPAAEPARAAGGRG
jgi:small conductance mechanosensitive channel